MKQFLFHSRNILTGIPLSLSFFANAQSLPNFTSVSGTQLTNTNGQWVTFNPAQPNNIDLVESRIFKMPASGQGILGVEFKVVGADGGTARFQWGLNDKFANAGRGGEINFTLPLQNTNNYDRPFFVTFGKKGESKTIHNGLYIGAGGGGSTGMAWLESGAETVNLNYPEGHSSGNGSGYYPGYLIAAAGGGSGGYATEQYTLAGKPAMQIAASSTNIDNDDVYAALNIWRDNPNNVVLIMGSGGSKLRFKPAFNQIVPFNYPYCCTNDEKLRALTSKVYNISDYTTGLSLGGTPSTSLNSISYGQGGGKPTTPFVSSAGTGNMTGLSLIQQGFEVLNLGGKGGSGFGGGGAGISTTSYNNINTSQLPTGGAGGTGSPYQSAYARKYPSNADAGWNAYASYLQNVSVTLRTTTNTPQNGKLMYRTIMDTEPPVVNNTTPINATLNANGTFPLTLQSLQPYIGPGNIISDNDGVKSIIFSQSQLTCSNAGQTVPVAITVTDFAGNNISTALYFTVTNNAVLAPVLPEPVPPGYLWTYANHIDASSGPVTLTAANFPQGINVCSGSGNGVAVHFPPTTFTCLHQGTQQQVTYYYTDNNNNQSLNYTKTFNIAASGSSAPPNIDIDVSNGPVTLSAAHFGGLGVCGTSVGITVHFPPTTFNCSHVGTPQPITYYLTDNYGNQSPNYTLTFNVFNAAADAPRFYVDAAATGSNNGLSWENAFTSLQDALRNNACNSNNNPREIYVAKGTYYPDKGSTQTLNDRNASFRIYNNFKLYGGFPSGGANFINRNPVANPTILSGEIGSTSTTSDNAHHVVTIAGNNASIDGFTIQKGYASDNINTGGGGLLLQQTEGSLSSDYTTTISNVKFLNNYGSLGGAMHISYNNTTHYNKLYVQNCSFESNSANNGGAVYLKNPSNTNNMKVELTNNVFNFNSAASTGGGALFVNDNASTTITNNTFANNTAPLGGVIYSRGSIKMYNSISYYNSGSGFYMYYQLGSMEVGNSNIQNSFNNGNWNLYDLQNLGGNIDANPLFQSPTNLGILPGSPSINAGLNTYNTQLYDIEGNPRVSQGTIDMGAYEINPTIYVAADAPAGGDGKGWATAFNNLNDGIQAAGTGQYQKEIWVKEGTYRPDRVPGTNIVTSNNKDNSFFLQSSKIYGGFAGTESNIAQRNIGQHPTILSGDLGVAGNITDNTYHVVTMVAGENRLDGLIIESGNAHHTTDINKNRGGGIFEYNQSSGANNMITNCVFRNNRAAENGGAVYAQVNQAGASTFSQCIFYNNTAIRGAASFIKMNNAVADSYDQNFHNITALNNASIGGATTGIFEAEEMTANHPANITFYNSLLTANNPQPYSDVTNPGHITLNHTYTAASNTGIFVNPNNIEGADGKIMTADDGLRLSTSSPAINYGDNTLALTGTDKDVAGNQRIINNIDAGAYESPYTAPLIAAANGVMYVKLNATGNGTDWNNATGDLHNAIQAAGVQKVFVAKGVYKVGDNSFMMKNGVQIYGGFDPDNGITDLSHNRIMPNAANLQGSILDGENARPLIWNVFDAANPMNNTAILDGFTITRGAFANGGGIRNVYASPTLNNLLIFRNTAATSGAGIYNENSSPLLTNAIISDNIIVNVTAAINGAGISNTAASAPVLTNVNIVGNTLIAPLGTMKGAGMYSHNSSPKIYNSIIWNNQKINNPAIAGTDLEKEGSGTLTLKNSITQGYNTGNASDNNKVNVNPLFTNLSVADYRLMEISPAINAGDNSLYPGLNTNTRDLANNSRVYNFTNNGKVDIGAYEYQCIYVDYSNVTFDTLATDYDGNLHSVAVQHLPQGASVTYEITDAANQTTTGNAAINAGVYTIKATMSVAGANCSSVLRTTTLTIKKIPAVITANDVQNYVYDGTVKNVTASLNHTETTLNYSPQQGYTNTGAYAMTVSAPETTNYLATSKEVILSIENADFTGVLLNDSTFTYDGTAKSLTISGSLPIGSTIVYGGNEKTDAGIYPVVVLVQMPNYNDMWLSATMTINNPLPLNLLSFTAEKQNETSLLQWVTAMEQNNTGFDVERSDDSKNWIKIGFVKSLAINGNSKTELIYQLTDHAPLIGKNFYRLKQIDFDGKAEYSQVRTLSFEYSRTINVYPNPAREAVTITGLLGGETITVHDISGKAIQSIKTDKPQITIKLNNLSSGSYTLRITAKGEATYAKKLIITK